jgi:hypothetical protein
MPPSNKNNPPHQSLNWYGLKAFGIDETSLPVTGDIRQSQLMIESVCFRISHAEYEGGLGRFGHFRNIVELLWNSPESTSFKKYKWSPWGERMIREMCEEAELAVAGCASAGKSDPAALYGVVSYITDPTHTLVITMSTSIKEARQRIWKTLLEYWQGVPNLPGAYMKSSNEIRGLNYSGEGYGQSSGILLLAGDNKESGAVNKLIGIKPPKTGTPRETYEEIVAGGEFADLMDRFDEETLRDLLPRLNNLSQNRTGKLIILLDEATGISSMVLDAIMSNMKFANKGHIQIVGLGNPDRIYDSFGVLCTPEAGWDKIDLENAEEWETKGGGKCIRFDAEKNPRILLNDDSFHWLPSKEAIDTMVKQYGRKSKYFIRMVKAMFSLDGGAESIYAPADIELSGARDQKVVWSDKPVPVSFLDPSFTAGGDRAFPTFGLLGTDSTGKMVLLRTGTEVIKVDVNNTKVPVNFQIVRQWKRMCEERGILPQNATYDRTGGGIPFGDIVSNQWSPRVTGITSAGPATKNKLHGEKHPGTKKDVLACERFANRATEIWYSAHPFFRSQQLRGVNEELAKELCSRQHAKKRSADARTIQVEDKRTYKDREGKSPDESDSYLGLVDFCKIRHGFRPSEFAETAAAAQNSPGGSAWKRFREKARRITASRKLKRTE